MKKRGLALGTLTLVLASCAPKASQEAVTQILRLGELEVQITAPRWVTPQAFYPLEVTYTNRAEQAVTFSDPFHCMFIWDVKKASGSPVPRPPGQTTYGCTTDIPSTKTLAPGESYRGPFKAIIEKFPKGQYRLDPEQLRTLKVLNYRVNGGEPRQPEFTPSPQAIRFEIR